ncbi:unnamed protein product, partial [Vitis vinifera]|uniref:C2H2-type domain-containing protein n=1 Tax=Vitis vinifera TaxID=29760 RepID=D7SI53_VITVI
MDFSSPNQKQGHELVEFKHVCKFCKKSFPCGRSLGGHMRSHMINSSFETDEKLSKTKLSSLHKAATNPDSWTSANQKLVMDSQSDTETAVPNRKKRSRRRTRYMATATSSSFSFANASSSVSEIEQEQEEVAISLMMLSRDSGNWGGLNSVVKLKKLIKDEKFNPSALDSEDFQFYCKQSEFGASGNSRNDSKLNKSEVLETNKSNKLKVNCSKKTTNNDELATKRSKLTKPCNNHSPSRSPGPIHGHTASASAVKAETILGSKKSKGHECPICLKVFSSGQALGGHKRSHLVGGSDTRGSQTIVIPKPLPEIRDLLDLNLPAPAEEEGGFKAWWVGSSHKHEPLVGMISN